MTNTLTADADATIAQIRRAEEAGVDIVRVSCPDEDSTAALSRIVRAAKVPIVADIHFHYRRAIEAARAGAACLRINPGNIGSAERVREVVKAARDHGCSMRIGVNAGSLEKDLLEKYGEPCPEAMVESALDHARILQDHDFHEFKITVKSSIGLGSLLWAGIGDTVRVSLSAEPEEEVRVGFELLKALGLRHRGVNIVSCPSCARQQYDVIRTVEALERRVAHITTPMTVSVIGCVVNGPGEARETDIGFTGGGNNTHQVYVSGIADHRLKDADIVDHLVELVEKKAAALEAAKREEAALALEPAQ
jgi:(E)-4-hydroxy-3-methylbut-2-enyl-diphosphate synthase